MSWFLKGCLLTLVTFNWIHAESNMTLVAKIIPTENEGYFIFSDGTYWKVSSFVKRWRSPLEWITGSEIPVPENYLCTIDVWSFGEEFEAYPKYGNSRVNEEDASNAVIIKNHSHILVNKRTEKVLFATPLHPADWASQVQQEGYNKGYSAGYSAGYSSGYNVGYSFGKSASSNSNRQNN
jgi:hypothetical protein